MKKSWTALFAALLTAVPAIASAKTILFVGNSFTYGEHSALKHYRADSVTDLNGTGIGGVPALFKAFAAEAGLDYDVSVESVGGKGLDYHYTQKLPLLDRKWDVVVLQGFSTLDAEHPGNPQLNANYARLFSEALHRRNPDVKIYLDATWSRADLTYPAGTPWHGKPIQQMAKDVDAGYRVAARTASGIAGVVPVGLAWNRALDAGVADPNPYDGIAPNQIDLWAFDNYHASAYGYYLETLMLFGAVTGVDPASLGEREKSIDDLGLDPKVIRQLEQVAHEQLSVH